MKSQKNTKHDENAYIKARVLDFSAFQIKSVLNE